MGQRDKEGIVFDIGSKNIKVVKGMHKDNNIEIKEYMIVPTPDGSIIEGKIYDKTKVAATIRDALKGKKIKSKNGMVTISSGEVILRIFNLPKMEEKELKEVIKYEIEYLLPNSKDNYVIDFTILEEYTEKTDEGNKMDMIKVQAAALDKSMVASYIDIFQKINIPLEAIDIQPNNLSKIFCGRSRMIQDNREVQNNIDKSVAIIDLGHEKTTISIMELGKVFLYRVINKGGKDITHIIGETLNIDDVAAEEWKINNNYLSSQCNEVVYSALRYFMQELMVEIYQLIEYFISKSRYKKLDCIYLIGGGAKAEGIDVLFQDFMNIQTYTGVDYRNIQENRKYQTFPDDILLLWNSLGMFLRKE